MVQWKTIPTGEVLDGTDGEGFRRFSRMVPTGEALGSTTAVDGTDGVRRYGCRRYRPGRL